MNLASPADPVTITNLPYDAGGNICRLAVAPARGRLWRRDDLSECAQRSGAGAILVLDPRAAFPQSATARPRRSASGGGRSLASFNERQ